MDLVPAPDKTPHNLNCFRRNRYIHQSYPNNSTIKYNKLFKQNPGLINTYPQPTKYGWIKTHPENNVCQRVGSDHFLKWPPGYIIYKSYKDCKMAC
jgi:hypothetical protein